MVQPHPYTVGVIADSHGELSRAVIRAFRDVDLIIHAGDSERQEVLDALRDIAPVHAVRGNMDSGAWAARLPRGDVIQAEDALLYALHDRDELSFAPSAAGFDAVIYGHTHKPNLYRDGGVLYLNPGSASRPRSGYEPSVALLEVQGKALEARFVFL